MGQETMGLIKIAIVDDQRLLRDGLIFHLQEHASFAVIWQARTGEEALHQCEKKPPHILLLDIHLPDIDGTAVIKQIRLRRWPIKILALSFDYAVEAKVREFGADDFLQKSLEFSDNFLINSLYNLAAKKSIAQPTPQESLPTPTTDDNPILTLSPRELEVLHCLAEGLAIKDISVKLCMSIETVRTNVKKIYRKLQVGSRGEAIALAYKYNIIATHN
jgi:DNA-binding NarL/FixJ family response regulator